MNSELNPEAPEFHSQSKSITEDGFLKVQKTVQCASRFPYGEALDMFKTYTCFNRISEQISKNLIHQSNRILSAQHMPERFKLNDNQHNTDTLVSANDTLLDRININLDTITGVNKPKDNFFDGLKLGTPNVSSWNRTPIIAKMQMGSTSFLGAKNIPRPQLSFKDPIDNSKNLWVPKLADKPNNIKPLALKILYNKAGEAIGYEHPYKLELDLYSPPAAFLEPSSEPPAFPPPIEDTKLTYIETEEQIDALVKHLCSVKEFACDVEHHSYRTYQGITCLLQISTDEGGDFVIDTLAAREYIHKLNVAFTDPKIVKVFHGADMDVLWLQRDFAVYIVGLFDTHQAAKALKLSGLSLKYLLMRYCHVDADKKYQLADWRMRPLPDELVKYARMDTHYLLFIWRTMRNQLLEEAAGQNNLLLSVFEQGRQICGTTYNKDVVTDESHMPLYLRSKKSFNTRQMAALKMLYKWRDEQARILDESVGYLLPNHMLLTIADELPKEVQGVSACCSPMPPFVKQNVLTIHKMILSCRVLPLEPHLYQMPAPIDTMRSVTRPPYYPLTLHKVPDVTPNLPIDLNWANDLVKQFKQDDKTRRVSSSEIKPNIAAHKMFLTPFDRYKITRSLAQVEEIKEFKEKEAKIAALSQNVDIIQTEVLVKLQQAKSMVENEKISIIDADEHKPESSKTVTIDLTSPNCIPAKRKRQEQDRKAFEPVKKNNTKVADTHNGIDTKPNLYKMVDYRRFYTPELQRPQTKAKGNKFHKKCK